MSEELSVSILVRLNIADDVIVNTRVDSDRSTPTNLLKCNTRL